VHGGSGQRGRRAIDTPGGSRPRSASCPRSPSQAAVRPQAGPWVHSCGLLQLPEGATRLHPAAADRTPHLLLEVALWLLLLMLVPVLLAAASKLVKHRQRLPSNHAAGAPSPSRCCYATKDEHVLRRRRWGSWALEVAHEGGRGGKEAAAAWHPAHVAPPCLHLLGAVSCSASAWNHTGQMYNHSWLNELRPWPCFCSTFVGCTCCAHGCTYTNAALCQT